MARVSNIPWQQREYERSTVKQKNKIQQILSIDLVAHIHVTKEKLLLRRHPQVPGSCPSTLCSTQSAASLFLVPFYDFMVVGIGTKMIIFP